MFYVLIKILKRVGKLAYKLLLPEGVKIHPIFHVGQLKQHLGQKVVPGQDLPLINEDGSIKNAPAAVLKTRQIPRDNLPVVQWLVQWENLPPDAASFEDADSIKQTFPAFFCSTVQPWLAANQSTGCKPATSSSISTLWPTQAAAEGPVLRVKPAEMKRGGPQAS